LVTIYFLNFSVCFVQENLCYPKYMEFVTEESFIQHISITIKSSLSNLIKLKKQCATDN